MSQVAKKTYEVAGLGKFGSNSHPVHPATIHFPLAFLAVANILNILYGLTLYAPYLSPFAADKENVGTIALAGYFLNIVGILGSIPAIVTGAAELYAMVNAKGLFITDNNGNKTLEPVVKIALLHASVSDFVVFGAIYNWVIQRNRSPEDYAPHNHQVVLSGGALGLLFFSAYLGGSLVYKHGVGVQRMGDGANVKKEELKKRGAKAD